MLNMEITESFKLELLSSLITAALCYNILSSTSQKRDLAIVLAQQQQQRLNSSSSWLKHSHG